MTDSTLTAATDIRFCVSCGSAVPVDAPFCEACGAAQALNGRALRQGPLWEGDATATESEPTSVPRQREPPEAVARSVNGNAGPPPASSEVAAESSVTRGSAAACATCGAANLDGAAFCEGCGAAQHIAQPAPPAWPPAIPVGGGEPIALLGLSALVLVLLCLHWYTAALSGSAPIDASGWTALTIGRALLLSSSVLIGLAAWSLLAPQAPLARVRMSRSDLGHLASSLGVLLAVYLVFRVASPPRFYRVTNYAHSYFGSDDSSVHAEVSVHAPAVLALLAVGGWVLVGMRLAMASPEGFSIERCWGVLRESAGSRRPRR